MLGLILCEQSTNITNCYCFTLTQNFNNVILGKSALKIGTGNVIDFRDSLR